MAVVEELEPGLDRECCPGEGADQVARVLPDTLLSVVTTVCRVGDEQYVAGPVGEFVAHGDDTRRERAALRHGGVRGAPGDLKRTEDGPELPVTGGQHDDVGGGVVDEVEGDHQPAVAVPDDARSHQRGDRVG